MVEQQRPIIMQMLSTTPPEPCGLATYGIHFHDAMGYEYGSRIIPAGITAIDSIGAGYKAPVERVIQKLKAGSWKNGLEKALDRMDKLKKQHPTAIPMHFGNFEFGLAPLLKEGQEPIPSQGRQFVDFAKMAKERGHRMIIQSHTMLTDPLPHQVEIYQALHKHADGFITLSESGGKILRKRYDINPNDQTAALIEHLHHGTWMTNHSIESQQDVRRNKYNIRDDMTVVLAAGLQGEGKGTPESIRGYGLYVNDLPDSERKKRIMFVAGRTHPGISEEEREKLERERESAIQESNLNVVRADITEIPEMDLAKPDLVLLERYHTDEELIELDSITDIGIGPYHNLQQIASGRLSESIAAGNGIITTPYVNAYDLLGNGELHKHPVEDIHLLGQNQDMQWPIMDEKRPRAVFVQPNSPNTPYQIAEGLHKLVDKNGNRETLMRMKINNRRIGKHFGWEAFVRGVVRLGETIEDRYTLLAA